MMIHKNTKPEKPLLINKDGKYWITLDKTSEYMSVDVQDSLSK